MLFDTSDFYYGILIGILLILIWKYFIRKENYSSKEEKADTIYKWWKNIDKPEYAKYKIEIQDSDVIEYSGVRELYKNNNLTKDNILRVIT